MPVVRWIRPTKLLKSKRFWILLILVLSSVGVYLFGLSTRRYEFNEIHVQQPLATEHDLVEHKAPLDDKEFSEKKQPMETGNDFAEHKAPLDDKEFSEIQQPMEKGNDFAEHKAPLDDKEKTARKNLIIVSHGRSGSTLTGDIFNHHPSVFYMYEPLQTPKRVQEKKKINDSGYNSLATEFLTGVFHCKFDNPDLLHDIERYYRKPEHPRISQAIGSPPLCPYQMTDPKWNPRHCLPMTNEVLGNACKDTYNLTVLKILMWRIPKNSIESILTACSAADVDCKVIFLVRDPRAMVPSSRKIGFFGEKGPPNAYVGTRLYSQQRCDQTQENLELVRRLPDSLRDRIKLLRYEDLATNPLKVLADIYEFAGLPVLESVRTWLNKTTHLSRNACDHRLDGGPVTCTKDDAWAAANRWRWTAQPQEINIIERYCGRVLSLMGYRPANGSKELLANRKIALFNDDYEAKHWFLR